MDNLLEPNVRVMNYENQWFVGVTEQVYSSCRGCCFHLPPDMGDCVITNKTLPVYEDDCGKYNFIWARAAK